jgi:hypothetical protein
MLVCEKQMEVLSVERLLRTVWSQGWKIEFVLPGTRMAAAMRLVSALVV